MDGRPPITWQDLARRIAAMTHGQRQKPVIYFDEIAGQVAQPGLRLAEDDIALDWGTAPIPSGTYLLARSAPNDEVPPHPADSLVLVALELHDGEEPPADFETATGVYYQLSEVEDVGDGRRMAWYFQQEWSDPA
jgi:hypothetical protein